MRYTLIIIVILAFAFSQCAQDDYSPRTFADESTIYSEDGDVTFRNILLILKPYFEEEGIKYYVATDSVKNIRVNINGQPWGVFNSIPKDTSTFSYYARNNLMVSDFPVKYSVIAPVASDEPDTLSTAGQYADMLTALFTLSPGYYMCEVTAFDLHRNDGSTLTVNPLITEPLEIQDGMESVFLGEFEVPLESK